MMKNKFLKIASGAMALAMAFPVLASCGKNNDTYDVDMNVDLTKKIDLRVLMPNSGFGIDKVNSDNNALLIERLTGYNVEYDQLPATDASARLNNLMLDHEMYNAMKLTTAQFADLVALDLLLPLDEVIDKFGPVLSEVISDESWEVATVNGKIYGIPERASSDNIENPIILRQDWIMALQDEGKIDFDMPTTTTEFRTMLVEMKNKYNVTPLTFDKYTPLIYAISSAFGIYTDWQAYEIDGKTEVRYYMDAPRYSEYVDYMAGLYKDGLIDVEISTNTSSDALSKFTAQKAGAFATSLWDVGSVVSGMSGENGVIDENNPAKQPSNVLAYLRCLENPDGEYKVYRTSGYTYITAIPFYNAKNAGYVIDWINSMITDKDGQRNFREIVIGEENKHWTYNAVDGYLPVKENFAEKDQASYYIMCSNETVYTEYWKARVRKTPELYRAWDEMMTDADEVGVRNIADALPPLKAYSDVRAKIELYAQDQFYVMVKQDGGAKSLATYLSKFKADGGTQATNAIGAWYNGKNN